MHTPEEELQDCIITFHLNSGEVLEMGYESEFVDGIWADLVQKVNLLSDYIEVYPTERFKAVLLQKSAISYISLRVMKQGSHASRQG